MMKIIGLTGGIGAGKTTVSDYLKKKGYRILDADRFAREITLPGSPVLSRLAGAFGTSILLPDGSLDRKKLGAMAFASEEGKNELDRITHGEIKKRILDGIAQAGREGLTAVFVDAPLLFEAGLDRYTDMVWLVDADDRLRIERLKRRDGLTERELWDRIARQLPREEKLQRADVVLDNSKTEEELYLQIEQVLKRYVETESDH